MKGLVQALSKTRTRFLQGMEKLVFGKQTIDPDLLEELEAVLLGADLGVHATDRLLSRLRAGLGRAEQAAPARLHEFLRPGLLSILKNQINQEMPAHDGPHVILGVGINGVGKTTTMAKLAARLKDQGKSVLLVAGDTFRAAAIEQLEIWAERVPCSVIRHQAGSDPSAVIFDGLSAAKARGVDTVIVDTAGRMHTRSNLMEELKKMRRVMNKALPGSPHEVLLVLDATTGQNGLAQARQFHEAVGVTGVVLTKLDGTAKGGVVVAIAQELGLPVRWVGVGEGIKDLEPFSAEDFVEGLFGNG